MKLKEVIVLLAKKTYERSLLMRASALAYTTLFSIVPFISITLIAIKKLGLGLTEEELFSRVQSFINNIFPVFMANAANREMVGLSVQRFHEFSVRVNAKSAGIIGAAFLAITSVMLLMSIEGSINDLWGIRKGRSFVKSVPISLVIIILTPLFIIPAISAIFVAQNQYVVNWLTAIVPYEWFDTLIGSIVLPISFITISLTTFYIITPNTRVRFLPALTGGLVSTLLLTAVTSGFGWIISFSGRDDYFKYVYGALASIPLILLFLYLSWIIVLFGAMVAYACQNAGTKEAFSDDCET